jgi:hypothetical protein
MSVLPYLAAQRHRRCHSRSLRRQYPDQWHGAAAQDAYHVPHPRCEPPVKHLTPHAARSDLQDARSAVLPPPLAHTLPLASVMLCAVSVPTLCVRTKIDSYAVRCLPLQRALVWCRRSKDVKQRWRAMRCLVTTETASLSTRWTIFRTTAAPTPAPACSPFLHCC